MTAGDVPANVSFNYQLPEVIAKVTGTQPGRHSRGISRESRKSPGRGFPTKSLGNDDISAVPMIFEISSDVRCCHLVTLSSPHPQAARGVEPPQEWERMRRGGGAILRLRRRPDAAGD